MDKVATGVEADEGGSSLPFPRTGVKLRSVIGGFESNFSGVFSTGTCSFPLATGSAADVDAKVAWCRAALALALAFFAGPRRRQRWPPEAEGPPGVGSVGDNDESSSSLILVLPALVEIDRVACLPSFSNFLKISNKFVNSSPIFTFQQNLKKGKGGSRKRSSLYAGLN